MSKSNFVGFRIHNLRTNLNNQLIQNIDGHQTYKDYDVYSTFSAFVRINDGYRDQLRQMNRVYSEVTYERKQV